MKYEYAFFDVDSLKLSSRGTTYVCNSQVVSMADKLYEVYNVISGNAAPLVFSMDVDVDRNPLEKHNIRHDFLSIPVSETEKDWKKSIYDWYKFYIEREVYDDKKQAAVFNSNKNAVDCIKSINSKEWIVFGKGLEYGVGHVIDTLLGLGENVKFVPELISPDETESIDQVNKYCKKWEKQGAMPFAYIRIMALTPCKKR